MSWSLETLESEEGQLNAVFACFGSAAQHAQFFEEALGEFLLAYNKICNKSLTISRNRPRDFSTPDILAVKGEKARDRSLAGPGKDG